VAGFCQGVQDLECRGILRIEGLSTWKSGGSCGCPRPCAVEIHARGYKERLQRFGGCHGLAPLRFTLAATKNVRRGLADATALRRGDSRSRLQRTFVEVWRMPRPCAVEIHDGPTKNVRKGLADATALRRGDSRWPLQRTFAKVWRMPRPCAVEIHARGYKKR
jgi:hypothetical protein